jgi:hypothetical protein
VQRDREKIFAHVKGVALLVWVSAISSLFLII